MRVLVTGGAGFIGSHVVDRLIEGGHEVLVVDDLSTGRERNVNALARLTRLDVCSREFVEEAVRFQPDAISHLAAQASVVASMADPIRDLTVNAVGGVRVAEAAVASGAKQVVYITTGGALYGVPEYLPCDEKHPIRPTSCYGLSKWTGEQYLSLLLPPAIPLKVLRLANVYGPRQDPHGEAGVVAVFSMRMLRGEPVSIFGDGEQTRDFVYVGDVVEAHARALASAAPLVANVGSSVTTTVNTVFAELAAATGYALGPRMEPERPGELRHSALDGTRLRELLGYAPATSVREGLRATVEWARADAGRSG